MLLFRTTRKYTRTYSKYGGGAGGFARGVKKRRNGRQITRDKRDKLTHLHRGQA